MKTNAAVLFEAGRDWNIMEVELDPPQSGEVLLRVEYSGLCHSDEHMRNGAAPRLPLIGGHEGSGVVEAIGPGVTSVAEGDHVVTSFLPTCGHCRWCLTGRSYLCDLGATIATGQLPDGTYRFHVNGEDVGGMCMLGTFSQWTVVPQGSVVKIDNDVPLEVACLLACGVPTGWGAAVNVARVGPGDVVVIYGAGGVGMNAVQGAVLAGAKTVVAVDPVPFKLDTAKSFGAHHGFTTHAAAMAFLVDHTRGVLADAAIIVTGNVDAEVVSQAAEAVSKGGRIVLTGMSDPTDAPTIALHGNLIAAFAKTLYGTLYGGCNPHVVIPRLADLYRNGQLKLDELVTRRYELDQLNDGYRDLLAGKNIRGVLALTH